MLLTFKKVGNHWYPDVKHNSLHDISLDPKFERLFNRMDKFQDNRIDVVLIKQDSIIIREGLIEFNESDILRYLTTNDSFIMDLYINEHHFTISSDLFTILEQNYQLNFHSEIYRIDI